MWTHALTGSLDWTIGIETGWAAVQDVSLIDSIETDSAAYPAYCLMDTKG
jgi:hypothetical protein